MDVHLEPWSDSALGLLREINTPLMREHVGGGTESEDELLVRHRRYLALPEGGVGRMYVIELSGTPVGSIAYHRRQWQGAEVFEAGWNVLPAYQGRGVAAAAGALLIGVLRVAARESGAPARLHAFPSVHNAPSNALCRRLGLTLLGPCDFEYPAGSGRYLRSNDWCLDLTAAADGG